MNCRRVPVPFITCGSNRQGCLGFRAPYQSSFKFEPSIVAVISAVGGLDLEEWALLRRVLGLIKECAPHGTSALEVFQVIEISLRAHYVKQIELGVPDGSARRGYQKWTSRKASPASPARMHRMMYTA